MAAGNRSVEFKRYMDVLPVPAEAEITRPHVFISHPGEVKYELVDHIRAAFARQQPDLAVFVDEWTIRPGEEGLLRISAACWGTTVGLLILTNDFVRKKYCMAELRILLQRRQDAKAARDAYHQQDQDCKNAEPEPPVQLLPVLYGGLTFEQLARMRAIYELKEEWCVAEEKPPAAVLDQWAKDLQALMALNVIRPDQWRGDAHLVDMIVSRAVEQLAAGQRLPKCAAPTLEVVNCATPSDVKLVGRQQELQKGIQALLHRGQRYAEIRGPPGEGKSTLARHLVAAVCEEWSHLAQEDVGGRQEAYVLEVDMKVLAEAQDMKAAVASTLLGMVNKHVPQGQWQALLAWLRKQPRVLVLFENAEDGVLQKALSTDVQEFVLMLSALRQITSTHVVVATRVEVPSINGLDPESYAIKLHQLTVGEGMEVINTHLGRGHVWGVDAAEEAAARKLVGLVQCNPLVLSVAAGLVQGDEKCKWQEVLLKAEEGLAAVRPAADEKPGGMDRHIRVLQGWLCRLLNQEKQQHLAALSVFAGSFTEAAAAAVTRSNKARNTLASLKFASLVKQREERIRTEQVDLIEDRYSLHALVREAAAALLHANPDVLAQCMQSLADWVLVDERGPGTMLLQCDPAEQVQPDMLHFWYIVREEVENFVATAAAIGMDDDTTKCKQLVGSACAVGRCLGSCGHGTAALKLLAAAVITAETVLGMDDPVTLGSKLCQGIVMWMVQTDLGQARILMEELLETSDRVLGADHPNTLTTKGYLNSIMWDMGEYRKPVLLEWEILASCTRTLGAQHLNTLASKSSLAYRLRALGEHQEARQLQEEVLADHIRVCGEEHARTLTSKSNLAFTLWDMGELEEAKKLQVEALESGKKVLGVTHPDTLIYMGNLAATLKRMGEVEKAAQLQNEVSKIRRKLAEDGT